MTPPPPSRSCAAAPKPPHDAGRAGELRRAFFDGAQPAHLAGQHGTMAAQRRRPPRRLGCRARRTTASACWPSAALPRPWPACRRAGTASVPRPDAFPRCAPVIHHGGARGAARATLQRRQPDLGRGLGPRGEFPKARRGPARAPTAGRRAPSTGAPRRGSAGRPGRRSRLPPAPRRRGPPRRGRRRRSCGTWPRRRPSPSPGPRGPARSPSSSARGTRPRPALTVSSPTTWNRLPRNR